MNPKISTQRRKDAEKCRGSGGDLAFPLPGGGGKGCKGMVFPCASAF